MFKEDKILIKRLKEGNEKAFKYIYDIYYKSLTIYCSNLTNNLQQAEDIVQNTLIKFWTNRERITINTSLKNYLYRAVYNGFASEYSKKLRKEKLFIQVRDEVINKVIELEDDSFQEKINLLNSAIEQLPKKCKRVFLMSKKQGYQYKEIANELNITEKAVEKNISRAFNRIREILNSHSKNILMFFLKNLRHYH